MIDAGHGGRPGAVYGSIHEKDITLAVALALGKKISDTYPNIKVVYTRRSDIDIELYKRGKIANDVTSDLFISIHVNASTSKTACGTETFIMGYDKSAQNMEVAMKENEVVTLEKDYKQKYEGFEPNSAESYIIFSLMLYSYISQSSLLASLIQEEFKQTTPMISRGVKQAPFVVLWQAAMPSVLTEIGFLSNAADRKFITSTEGQEKIAGSIFNAFNRYKNFAEGDDATQASQTKEISKKPAVEAPAIVKEPITFKVQILTTTKLLKINSQNFDRFSSMVEMKNIGNEYKYFVKGCENYKDALSLQIELKKLKFKDAFVVAYRGDTQIKVSDALRETGL
ncbi:MAG: N-acetylmuramoyl-L-alanine amidase [Rikenellaceae bacterium]